MPRGSRRPSSALRVLSGDSSPCSKPRVGRCFSFGRVEIGEPPTFSLGILCGFDSHIGQAAQHAPQRGRDQGKRIMMFRKVLLAVAFTSLSSVALATSGTPQEQAACSPDVRKFCKKVPPGSDDSAYLACLENNRDALSIKCLNVLMDHGR